MKDKEQNKNRQPVTQEQYLDAMDEIDRLWLTPRDTPPDGDKLDHWIEIALAYENEHYPIEPPTMEEAIEFHMMDRLGVVRYKAKDWEATND